MGEFSINASLLATMFCISRWRFTPTFCPPLWCKIVGDGNVQAGGTARWVHRKLAELGATKGIGSLWVVSVRQEVCHRQIWTVCLTAWSQWHGAWHACCRLRRFDACHYDLRDDRANIRSIYTDLRALMTNTTLLVSQHRKQTVKVAVRSCHNDARCRQHRKSTYCCLVITINKTEEEEAKGEARLSLLVRVTSREGSAFALNKTSTNALHWANLRRYLKNKRGEHSTLDSLVKQLFFCQTTKEKPWAFMLYQHLGWSQYCLLKVNYRERAERANCRIRFWTMVGTEGIVYRRGGVSARGREVNTKSVRYAAAPTGRYISIWPVRR